MHAFETLAITDVEIEPKLLERRGGQPLGEDVSELENRNMLVNEVEINLNMLGALMLDKVGGEVDSIDVIAIDKSGPRQGLCSSTSS
jgi:hypothetical protein